MPRHARSASISIIASCSAAFQKRGYLLRAYYYTALVEDQEYSSIRPLIDWLDYNGYKVVTKPAKEFTDSTGRRKVKGNMDIELAVDALELADYVDHFVIFSGDGDFRSLVEALQRRGRKVSIVSTLTSQPPMISDDLRRQADHFIDLATLRSEVGRDPSQRPLPAAPNLPPADRRLLTDDACFQQNRSATALFVRACTISLPSGAIREPGWHNAPVPTFLPPDGDDSVRLLIVGLAPGLRGANRTGRPFTGDYAGDLLYSTLIRFGFARGEFKARPDDGLELVGTAITNAVRCVPPENKPTGAEISTCRTFLSPTLSRFPKLSAVLALGAIARPVDRAGAGRPRRRLPVQARGGRNNRSRDAFFQLSLLALQYEHRRFDGGDVYRRLQADSRVPEKLILRYPAVAGLIRQSNAAARQACVGWCRLPIASQWRSVAMPSVHLW